MKPSLLILTVIAGLLFGGISLATDSTGARQAGQSNVNAEPEDLADDICWVAPEWRND